MSSEISRVAGQTCELGVLASFQADGLLVRASTCRQNLWAVSKDVPELAGL
jgi:hypothetical protein